MSIEMKTKEPARWMLAQNMLLSICMKAMLNKLDPEVSREVARAMSTALQTGDEFVKAVAAETLELVLPEPQLKAIRDEMARMGQPRMR